MKKISRRKFLVDSATLSAAFPLAGMIRGCGLNAEINTDWLKNGMPYIRENGINIVFYFINLSYKHHHLIPTNSNGSYIVVQLPPQSLHETYFDSQAPPKDVPPDQGNSKLSGFSYLSFRLWPSSTVEQKLKFSIENLMAWDNTDIFKLTTTLEFKDSFWNYPDQNSVNAHAVINQTLLNNQKGLDRYKAILKKILKDENSFITIFELPADLILAPHTVDPNIKIPVIQNTYALARQSFNIEKKAIKFRRTVQERWDAEIRFQQTDSKASHIFTSIPPALRAIGLIIPSDTDLTSKNPDDPCNYVPVKLPPDNYLPSMLDEFELLTLNNIHRDNPNYNIQVNGPFLLTSLGATMKFTYKNFVFADSDKALSLVEYEHHFQDGRDNYIKVSRIGCIAPTGQKALHIKIAERKIIKGISFMDYKEYVEIIEKNKAYPEPGSMIKDTTYKLLAGRSDNYVNQFGMSKVRAGITRTDPIIPRDDTIKTFWAYKDGGSPTDAENLLLVPFTYWDSNGKQLDEIKAPIYFMRRDFFCSPHAVIDKFLSGKIDPDLKGSDDQKRLHLPFGNQIIAFTKDQADSPPTDAGNPTLSPQQPQTNKINQLPTEYIDYYFNIATPINQGNIFDHAEHIISLQTTRVKVYVDHIQQYSQGKIPSLIEYADDYLNNTFDSVKNNAKLILQHTPEFINGKINTLADLPIPDTELNASYQKILGLFNNAGDRIGGLANPGVQIERFALVQQAISLPEKVNSQWSAGSGRVLKTIDIFKDKSASILNGVDLRMILDEFLPAGLTPNFDLSKILTDIEKVTDYLKSIGNSQIVLNAMAAVKQIDADVKKYDAEVIQFQTEIQTAENQLVDAKNKLTAAVSDLNKIKSGARLYFEQQRLFLIADIKTVEADVMSFVQQEFVRQYNNASAQFKEQLKVAANIASIKTAITAAITQAITQLAGVQCTALTQLTILNAQLPIILKAALDDLFSLLAACVDLSAVNILSSKFTNNISTTSTFPLSAKFADYTTVSGVPGYIQLSTGINTVTQQFHRKEISEAELAGYKKNLDDVTAKIQTSLYYYIQLLFSNHDLIIKLVADADQKIVHAFYDYLDILQKGAVGYYVDRYYQLTKDYNDTVQTLIGTQKIFKDLEPLISLNATARKNLVSSYVQALIDGKDIQDLNFLWGFVQNSDSQLFADISDKILSSDYVQSNPVVKTIQNDLNKYSDSLKGFKTSLNDSLNKYRELLQLQAEGMVDQVRDEFKKQVDGIVDLKAIKEANEQLTQVIQFLTTPQKQTLKYQWETSNFKPADVGILRFNPESSPATKLTVNVLSNVYFDLAKYPSVINHIDTYSENTLVNFGITFLSVITVNFANLKFVTGSGVPTSVTVKIRSVTFDGALSFIQQLEDLLGNLGDGFGISINPNNVAILYNSPTFSVGSPGFTFANISFGVTLRIFFNQQPLQLTFNLARPDSKAVISASIYGGCFFCAITMEAKRGIVGIEMAIEMGAYLGISLGPISGEVKFMVGLYYKKDDSGVLMEGYFIAEGTLSVWILSVSARLYMYVRSQNSSVQGGCTASYSIKLGFIKKSFSGSYSKTIAGAESNSSGSGGTNSPKVMAELKKYYLKADTTTDDVDLSDIFEDDNYQVLNQQEWIAFYNLFYR